MRPVRQLVIAWCALLAVLAAPRGVRAQWITNGRALCTASGDQTNLVAVSDGAGGVIVAWTDRRGATFDVFAQHLLSTGFVDPAWPANGRALCTAAGDQTEPAIVTDGTGGAIVAWTDRRGGAADIYAQHVLASGIVDGGWIADGSPVCTAPLDQRAPALTRDLAGGAVVTWVDYRAINNSDIYVQHLLSSGAVDGGWTANGLPLCGAAHDQLEPRIVSDGLGGAIVTWTDARSGSYTDIYAHRVRANGAVDVGWSLDGRAICTAAFNQGGPNLVSDDQGGAIITWYDARNGVDYDVYAQHVFRAGGLDGAWPVDGRALVIAAGHQILPALIRDEAGGAIVTWQDSRGTNRDIYAQHLLAAGDVDPAWPSGGRALCTAAGDQSSPAIVADGAGGAIVTWYDNRSGSYLDVYANHVADTGGLDGAWPVDGREFSNIGYVQLNPIIVADGAGGAIVAWQDYRDGATADVYADRIRSCGEMAWAAGCQDGIPVTTATFGQQNPVMAPDGAGGAFVAWQDARNGNLDIFVHHVRPSGAVDPAWPVDGRAACVAAGAQTNPAVAADGAGGAFVTWQDRRGANDDVYAQHVQATGALDPGWLVNGQPVCIEAGDQQKPIAVPDGAGGAVIVWQDNRSLGTTGTDLYAQQIQSSGAVSWLLTGVPVCTAANQQDAPGIVSDGAGGAIVAWQDLRSGASDIVAQRVLSSGNVDPGWPANGRVLCAAAGNQQFPGLVGDGAGGAIVAWQDRRGGTSDVYAQHVLVSGAVDPGWTADGVALCAAANDQQLPAIAADGVGGAIVAWEDFRNLDLDVFAQHVLSSGTVDAAWPVDGLAVATASGAQQDIGITGDGAGGAILAWQDLRGGAGDIYAHHVQAAGAVDADWPANGRVLCAAANRQALPAVVSDEAGGAHVVWQDLRGGNYEDLYVQHVAGSGAVLAAPHPRTIAGFQMLAPYPNPARDARVVVRFDLAATRRVSAHVLDVCGRRVRSLAVDREFAPGRQSLEWNARDEAGAPLPAGVYFVSVRAGDATDTKRVALVR